MEQKGGGKLEFGPWSEAPVYVGMVSKKEGLEGQGNVEGETLVEGQRGRGKEGGPSWERRRFNVGGSVQSSASEAKMDC